MGLKSPSFSGLAANTINVGTIESQDATSVKIDLGDDAGDDFIVDTNKLVVEGDNGRVGIGTAAPGATLGIDGDLQFQPTASSTGHITATGSLRIRADSSMYIGDDGADSIRLGRTNTTAAKIHLRSGTDTDMVLFNSKLGLGTETPGTQLQVEGTAPYITLKNSTSENTEGGCESQLSHLDHAGVVLAATEGSHSGSSDDTKGKYTISTHTGSALTTAVTISDSQEVTFSSKVKADDSVSIKEKAAANADVAAYGQLWVKTATPNELYFTTDAGNDIQITTGTAMASAAAANNDANLILHMQVFS